MSQHIVHDLKNPRHFHVKTGDDGGFVVERGPEFWRVVPNATGVVDAIEEKGGEIPVGFLEALSEDAGDSRQVRVWEPDLLAADDYVVWVAVSKTGGGETFFGKWSDLFEADRVSHPQRPGVLCRVQVGSVVVRSRAFTGEFGGAVEDHPAYAGLVEKEHAKHAARLSM
jgi:hypothetical protein